MLIIIACFQLECQISVDAAGLLLTRSPNVKTVKLVRVKKLTDRVLAEWLQVNPFEQLETVRINLSKCLFYFRLLCLILLFVSSHFTVAFKLFPTNHNKCLLVARALSQIINSWPFVRMGCEILGVTAASTRLAKL